MKYDIYRGTEKDMKETEGILTLKKCDKTQVKQFCVRHGINLERFIGGDYLVDENGIGFWLEEAM
jgi:hypothetical protein